MAQWPEWMRPGVRVVRGPDYNATIRDLNRLDLGTLSYVPKQAGDNKVNVVWDNGLERSYRSGYTGHYDLRAYDIQQVGVEHKNKVCAGCKQKPISGIRYHCTTCAGSIDLCTRCYMADKHDKSHTFARFDTEKSSSVPLPSRESSEVCKVYGVFKDAVVIRGPHWHYTTIDGGDNNKGTVMSFIAFKNHVSNGWLRVKWDISNNVGEYRMGAEGAVEVVAAKAVHGGNVYADHLPVVGIIKLKNGDKVKVNLSLKEFKQAQTDGNVPGGWKDEMKQCLKEIGTIMEVLYKGKYYRVQYQNGVCHIVIRQALYRLSGFSVGGVVKVIDNDKALRSLQDGHGGYNADVGKAKGQLGRVIKVGEDGDMKVLIDQNDKKKVVVLSPACCDPVHDPGEIGKAPKKPDSDDESDEDEESESDDDDDDDGDDGEREQNGGARGGRDMVDDGRIYAAKATNPEEEKLKEDITEFQSNFGNAFDNMKKLDTEEEGNAMFDAFTKADLPTVQALIQSKPELLDFKLEGRTILHMACHEGYLDLIKFLMSEGADIKDQDEEGDTPLHYAAFGKQPDCVQELLEKGALPNVQNKSGVIPLHIAIGQPCIDSIQYLVTYGSDVNLKSTDGETCMHDAVVQEDGQPLITQAVLNAQNADYSIPNEKGFNVLKWAALKNNQAATRLVCENAINMVNETAPDGFTALHIAAANDNAEIASILLDQGKANPDERDKEGRAPLHLAVYKGHKRMIEILVNRGADINAQNNYGNTPLHLTQTKTSMSSTARNTSLDSSKYDKSIQILFFLIEKGASLDIKNKRGETPLDLVKDRNVRQMIVRVTSAYQKAQPKTQGGVRIPMHWKKMEQVHTLDIVTLDQKDPVQLQEFQEIARQFASTLSQCHIQAIKRVQNPLLWEHYTLKKREFEAKLGQGMSNEQQLYHGTSSDLVDVIAADNFDFRIAGERVGALYGNGAYFASTAKYSDLYSMKDSSTGLKSMFVAKVLVGKICQGEGGMKRPPNIDPNDFRKGQYDTAVNNTASPTIFCVFDRNQYYPEYVVEYY